MNTNDVIIIVGIIPIWGLLFWSTQDLFWNRGPKTKK